jgi:hypothetical protein
MAATPSGPRTRRPEGPAILLRLRTTVNGTERACSGAAAKPSLVWGTADLPKRYGTLPLVTRKGHSRNHSLDHLGGAGEQ